MRAGVVLLCGVLLPVWVQAAPPTVETTLANGMKIIVREDRRSPQVLHQVWYRVGSVDEPLGRTGISHVLEHMMFRGTRTVSGEQFKKLIAAAGGEQNAQTSQDYTVYFQRLPKQHLELAMRLESDRMRNLVIKDAVFQTEREVVHEERRMRTDDDPQSLVFERFNSIAWLAHPYRTPVIGWPDDIRKWTVADLQDWYRQWYAPNNATLVVVGDVVAADVIRLARKYYGRWPAVPLPQRRITAEPEPDGERRISVRAPSELGYVLIGVQAPGVRDPQQDWEPYALDLLARVLDGHNAARLSVNLVQKGLVQGAFASYGGIGRGPEMFYLGGTPRPGQSDAEYEQLLLAEVQRVAEQGVAADELERVKRQARAAKVYEQDSMYVQARRIGTMEMAGLSWRDLDLLDQRLQSITAEQVQAVARKYFARERLVVATLLPQPVDKQPRAPKAAKGGHHAH